MAWPKGRPRGPRKIRSIEQLVQDVESADKAVGQDMSEILPGEIVGCMAHQREPMASADLAVLLLRDLLEATRVRSIVGFRAGRCRACDRPHPANMNICRCVCHRARAFLAQLGVEVAT